MTSSTIPAASLGDRILSYLENSWIAYRALFRWYNPKAYLASKLLLPMEQIIMYTLLGRFTMGPEWVTWVIIGNCVLMAAQNGVYGLVITLGEERFAGTLPLFLSSPGSRFGIFIGRSLVHILDGMLNIVLALLFAALVFRVDFSGTHWGTLAAAITVAAVSTAGFGLLLGSLSLMVRDIFMVMNFAYMSLMILAGVIVPPERLPAWIAWAHSVLPISRSAAVARQALEGVLPSQVAGALGMELVVGAVFVLLGFSVYGYLETGSRRKGKFDL